MTTTEVVLSAVTGALISLFIIALAGGGGSAIIWLERAMRCLSKRKKHAPTVAEHQMLHKLIGDYGMTPEQATRAVWIAAARMAAGRMVTTESPARTAASPVVRIASGRTSVRSATMSDGMVVCPRSKSCPCPDVDCGHRSRHARYTLCNYLCRSGHTAGICVPVEENEESVDVGKTTMDVEEAARDALDDMPVDADDDACCDDA